MQNNNNNNLNFEFSKDTNNLNKKLQGFYRQKDQKFDHFFDELTTEYKLFKKMTHECQMVCFGNASFNRKQSDACARQCLDPYLYIRKSIGDKIGQCDQQFQQQESKCMSSTDMDQCYSNLVSQLGVCLQQNTQFAKDQYKSVLSHFLKK
ncbi:unnamed protein product [Paramecium pentaurelia]|uniref:Tim10/DDP family zinc finger protein n=1 Tax=Paramecium pentaurelia TaxID=43138 RepID=A0A8S1RYR2_9CILI|nr:unnamed protein product [Paramecium pentaurelia]